MTKEEKREYDKRYGLIHKKEIAEQVIWPTPRAQDGPHGPTRDSLGDKVRWPTPAKRDWRSGENKNCWDNSRPLNEVVKIWPTPRANKPEGYSSENFRPTLAQVATEQDKPLGGQLNPDWVEWLMGWPIGWTDLKPLGMGRFQKWLQQHGKC